MDVGAWLRRLGLERYEATFRDNGVDETVLPSLTADGSRAASDSEVATALAPSCADTAVVAPVTATPAMNLRRLTFGPFVLAKSLRGMSSSM